MKKIITVFLIVAAAVFAQSNDTEAKIKMVLESWNEANNAKDIDTLSRLYSSRMIYYGSKLSREKCLRDKKRFFYRYPYFSQSVKNVHYASLAPGLEKISFDKYVRTKPNSQLKMYPSYLLVDTSSPFPAIVEEGDVITDRNLKRRKRIQTFSFRGIHQISGIVEEVKYYGPPGYGDNPKEDKLMTAYVLKLEHPIRVVDSNPDSFNETVTTTEVQLVINNFALFDKARRNHHRITVNGEFFSANTGHHIRKLLMDVKSLKYP